MIYKNIFAITKTLTPARVWVFQGYKNPNPYPYLTDFLPKSPDNHYKHLKHISYYYTIFSCSAGGVTCDWLDEFATLAKCSVMEDMS